MWMLLNVGCGRRDTQSWPPRLWRTRSLVIVSHGSDIFFLGWDDRTCFWGGDTFAPKLKVKNQAGQEVSIQEFLQGAFLDMFDKLVEAVGDLDSVIGFEVSARRFSHFIDLADRSCVKKGHQ
jgi:hypothetical protein